MRQATLKGVVAVAAKVAGTVATVVVGFFFVVVAPAASIALLAGASVASVLTIVVVALAVVAALTGLDAAISSPWYIGIIPMVRKQRLAGRGTRWHDQIIVRQSRALRQARTLLDLASFVLPRKITGECIGDCVEVLEKASKEGVHPWKLQAKALVCVFWAAIFTLRELAKPAAFLAALWRLLSGSLW